MYVYMYIYIYFPIVLSWDLRPQEKKCNMNHLRLDIYFDLFSVVLLRFLASMCWLVSRFLNFLTSPSLALY